MYVGLKLNGCLESRKLEPNVLGATTQVLSTKCEAEFSLILCGEGFQKLLVPQFSRDMPVRLKHSWGLEKDVML